MEPLGYIFHCLFFSTLWIVLLFSLMLCKVCYIYQQFRKHKKRKFSTFWWDWLLIAYLLLAIIETGLFFYLYPGTGLFFMPFLVFPILLLVSRFFYFQKFSWADWILVFPFLFASVSIFFCFVVFFPNLLL